MPIPFLSAIPVVGKILDTILGVVDKAVVDKDAREKLRAEIQAQMLQMDYSTIEKEIEARAKILLAEIQNQSWLARNWRPLLMLVCIAIVANNYILYPYLTLFNIPATPLELPEKLWALMLTGVNGYLVLRSGEKMIDKWKNGNGKSNS